MLTNQVNTIVVCIINHKITKLFKNQNIKTTVPLNSNKTDFDRIKPKTNKLIHNLNVVYKIECPDCKKYYVCLLYTSRCV